MIVVSNASPLINLSRVGLLKLVPALYGAMLMPRAVWDEIVVEGAGQPGADEIKAALWIETRTVANVQLVQVLRHSLDAGESEAIALALEVKADLLLMDERLGREMAQHLGLDYTGLIGMLVEAKRRGLLQAIKPCLDALRNLAGFRISDALYTRVLEDEQEV